MAFDILDELSAAYCVPRLKTHSALTKTWVVALAAPQARIQRFRFVMLVLMTHFPHHLELQDLWRARRASVLVLDHADPKVGVDNNSVVTGVEGLRA